MAYIIGYISSMIRIHRFMVEAEVLLVVNCVEYSEGKQIVNSLVLLLSVRDIY